MSSAEYPRLSVITDMWEQGTRARDWPLPVILDLLENPEVAWLTFHSHLLAYFAYLDRLDFREARRHIQWSEVEASRYRWDEPNPLVLVKLELAFVLGLLGEDLEEAEALLSDVDFPLKDQEYLRYRAKAALSFARGDINSARSSADRAAELLRTEHPDPKPNIQAELDWLAWIFERPRKEGAT